MLLGMVSIRPALECCDSKIPKLAPQPGSHLSNGHAGVLGEALNACCVGPASERRPLSMLSCCSSAWALVSISARQSIRGGGSLAAPTCAASDDSTCCSVADSRATAARRGAVTEARERGGFCTCTRSRARSSGVIGNAKSVMSTTSAECPALRNITMTSTTWAATTATVTAALRGSNADSSNPEMRATDRALCPYAICCWTSVHGKSFILTYGGSLMLSRRASESRPQTCKPARWYTRRRSCQPESAELPGRRARNRTG